MAGWELTEGREGRVEEIMPPLQKLLYYRYNTGIMAQAYACPSVLISEGIPLCMARSGVD